MGVLRRRAAGKRVALAIGIAAVMGLIAYGVLTPAGERSVDERLSQARPTTPAGFELPILQVGEPGPRLAGKLESATRDGIVDLADLRGHPVVVNFWASWCGPCREEGGLLSRGWERHRRDGVIYLGVNEKDTTDDARAFLERYRATYLNVRAPDDVLSESWGARGYPETYFLTARGEIVAHVAGVISPAQLVDGVEAAKTGRVLGRIQGGAQGTAPSR